MDTPPDWRNEAPELLVYLSDAVVELLGELMPGGFTKEEKIVIGFEAACRLSYAAGGTNIYFASADKLEEIAKRQRILQSYDGTNLNKVAIDVGLCNRVVYNVIKKQRLKNRTKIN